MIRTRWTLAGLLVLAFAALLPGWLPTTPPALAPLAEAANTFADLSGSKYAYNYVQSHAAADATVDHPIFRCATAVKCRIIKVTVVPGAAVTGAATNNYALVAKTWTDAATPVATAQNTVTFASGTNEVAMKARALWSPTTPVALAVGEYLSIERTLNGTGLASPNYAVVVEWDNGG